MKSKHEYQPLHGGSSSDSADDSTEVLPTWQSLRSKSDSRRSLWICAALLCASLLGNIIQAYAAHLPALSSYARLPLDVTTLYRAQTDFQSPNRSVADAAWDTIDTNPAAVAISSARIKEMNLMPSVPFPWDEDKSIYFIKGYHQLHCVKYLRRAFVVLERGLDDAVRFDHVYHCLDMLRQIVVCNADDTPQAFDVTFNGGRSLANNEPMQCRDWGRMAAWAQQPAFDACYNEISDFHKVAHSLELYGFCKPESPYFPIMQSYFDIHGHKPMFDDDDGAA